MVRAIKGGQNGKTFARYYSGLSNKAVEIGKSVFVCKKLYAVGDVFLKQFKSIRQSRSKLSYECDQKGRISVFRKRPVREAQRIRTKTDTGGRVEYTKAIERTILKELGNESWT